MNGLIGWQCTFYDGMQTTIGIIYDKYIHASETYYIVLDTQGTIYHKKAIYISKIHNKLIQ